MFERVLQPALRSSAEAKQGEQLRVICGPDSQGIESKVHGVADPQEYTRKGIGAPFLLKDIPERVY
jgi:hypothetical protein